MQNSATHYIGVVGRIQTCYLQCDDQRTCSRPELFSTEGPFNEWLDHFDSVVKVSGWGGGDAAQRLAIRLVNCTKVAHRRLPDETRRSYGLVKAAYIYDVSHP